MDQLSTLQREIEALKEKKTHALATKQAAESRMRELEEEMRALGVSPDTIEAEISRLSQEASVSTEQLTAMIANIKAGNYQAVILGATPPAPDVPSVEPQVTPVAVPPSQPTQAPTDSFMDDLFSNL